MLELTLIGPPRAVWRGTELKFPTRKARALVVVLALGEGRVQRDEVADLLWSRGGKRNLRSELHRLRRLPGADRWLVTDDPLDVIAVSDVRRFKEAVTEGRFGDALALWPEGETALRGLDSTGTAGFEEWVAAERARLQASLVEALRGRASELERDGSVPEALDLTRRLIAVDDLDEAAYRVAMRLELARGNVEGALTFLESCRRTLARELGIEPLAETLEVARQVERAVLVPTPGVVRMRARIPDTLLRPPHLVGREREWLRLEEAYAAGKTVNVSGPPGIGKTRLVLDFVRSKGTVFLLEGRLGDATLPYACYSRALRAAVRTHPQVVEEAPTWVREELARLLPGTDLAGSPRTSSARPPHMRVPPPGRLRLFEALVHTMDALRSEVAAIVVDDLHDLDAASFEEGVRAQARLMTRSPRLGYGRLIATYRSGELPPSFERSLALAATIGIAVTIRLEPLDEGAVRALLASTGLSDAADLAHQLYRLTGGNPAFVIETIKAALEAGSLDAATLALVGVPERVGAIITQRLERLERPAQRLVQAIGAVRAADDLDLLASVLGVTPLEVAERVAELERGHVLGDGAFVHDLLLETVVTTTPHVVARLLHRRIAEVLEARLERVTDPRERAGSAARIAQHLSAAGEDARATAWWRASADAYASAGLSTAARDIRRRTAAR